MSTENQENNDNKLQTEVQKDSSAKVEGSGGNSPEPQPTTQKEIYPPTLRKGQVINRRLNTKDLDNLNRLFKHLRKKKVKDQTTLQPRHMNAGDVISYCLNQTRKSECW